jgi:hypothetical protein
MHEWLDGIAGPQYTAAILWTAGALVLLVVILILIRLVRGFSSGTFVAGGRNRRARLAVMDAAAVDSQRRLVLVRRDDVEHLILIGGPTDVVVEQNITVGGTVRQPPSPSDKEPVKASPHIVPRPSTPIERPQTVTPISQARPRTDPIVPMSPSPAARPMRPIPRVASDTVPPVAQPAPVPEVVATVAERAPAPNSGIRLVEPATTATGPAPAAATHPRTEPAPDIAPAIPDRSVAATAAATTDVPVTERDFDAALDRELLSGNGGTPAPKEDASLEDEMKRLLGELSSGGRK